MESRLWRPSTQAGEEITHAIVADPGGALLVFDFDGTLSEIELYPENSTLNQQAADALAVIGPLVGRVAFITGRAAATMVQLSRLDERPGLEHAVVFGQYGVERWELATGLQTPAPPHGIAVALAELQVMIDEAAKNGRNTQGLWLEDKELGIGVHYRRSPVPQEVEAWLPEQVVAIGRRNELVVEPGREVVELRAFEVTKGDALGRLIDELHPRIVVVAGDDLGDVPALQAAWEARNRGMTTANVIADCAEVSELQALADIVCLGPQGVAAWLQELAAQLADTRVAAS